MRKYLANSLWVLSEKVIRLTVVFCLFSYVSQKLSVYDFGVFSLAQTIASLMIGIVAFGFDNVLIKEFAISEKVNEVFSTAFIFRMMLSTIVVLIFLIYTLLSDYKNVYKAVFLISSFSVFFQVQTIYYSYYQAISRSKVITKTSVIALVISSLIKITIIYLNLGLVYYTLSFCLDYLFSFLLIFLVSRKGGLILSFKFFNKKTLTSLLRQSSPILISTLIVMIYTRVDQFMIAQMTGMEDVARFSVAVRISDAYMFIPLAISASFFPMVANDSSASNIRKYFNITHFFTVISGLLVILLTPFIVNSFFGERYHNSISVIYIIVIANIISSLGSVSTNILIIRGITYLRIYRAIYGLVINVVLNFLLIPKFGMLGAAYASLFSQIIAAWISNAFTKKTRDCFYYQSLSLMTFGIPAIKDIIRAVRKV
ncbi:flippase [Rahnella inusitata]|uniref:flippase n=1 Tax=Rahnella inusitata TaxID=58169 RepID=UPI001BC844E3|nr:flippase [Rahnella inusitata]QUT14843.1 flippase [Rahnella inusitata]